MAEKKVPFTKDQIEKIIEKYPTPFHIYDEKAMVANAKDLKTHFHGPPGSKTISL